MCYLLPSLCPPCTKNVSFHFQLVCVCVTPAIAQSVLFAITFVFCSNATAVAVVTATVQRTIFIPFFSFSSLPFPFYFIHFSLSFRLSMLRCVAYFSVSFPEMLFAPPLRLDEPLKVVTMSLAGTAPAIKHAYRRLQFNGNSSQCHCRCYSRHFSIFILYYYYGHALASDHKGPRLRQLKTAMLSYRLNRIDLSGPLSGHILLAIRLFWEMAEADDIILDAPDWTNGDPRDRSGMAWEGLC